MHLFSVYSRTRIVPIRTARNSNDEEETIVDDEESVVETYSYPSNDEEETTVDDEESVYPPREEQEQFSDAFQEATAELQLFLTAALH